MRHKPQLFEELQDQDSNRSFLDKLLDSGLEIHESVSSEGLELSFLGSFTLLGKSTPGTYSELSNLSETNSIQPSPRIGPISEEEVENLVIPTAPTT